EQPLSIDEHLVASTAQPAPETHGHEIEHRTEHEEDEREAPADPERAAEEAHEREALAQEVGDQVRDAELYLLGVVDEVGRERIRRVLAEEDGRLAEDVIVELAAQ